MPIVASLTRDRNATLVLSPDALGQLGVALAQRSALARSLSDAPTESECAAFVLCDAQVQAQVDAWLDALAEGEASA